MTTFAEKKCRRAERVAANTVFLSAVLIFAMAAPAAAQIAIGTAEYRTYDYDPMLAGTLPGAIHVGHPAGGSEVVYHVTRSFTKTTRSVIDPTTGIATFNSMTNQPDSTTGGVSAVGDISYTRGSAVGIPFSGDEIQRHDFSASTRVRFPLGVTIFQTSDVHAVSNTSIWTSAAEMLIELAPVSATGIDATVNRWMVGGGAGSTYLSGVRFASASRVYISKPLTNSVAEVDTTSDMQRDFLLADVGAAGPQQIDLAPNGDVWVATSSGKLVKIDPVANTMQSFEPVTANDNVIAIAATSSLIGQNEASFSRPRTGQLLPLGEATPVRTTTSPAPMNGLRVTGTPADPGLTKGTVPPVRFDSTAIQEPAVDPGIFVRSPNPPPGTFPLGIDNSEVEPPGTWWGAEGFGGPTFNRIFRVKLPIAAGGKVTGGGSLHNPDGSVRSNFGFVVMQTDVNTPPKGQLEFNNKVTGDIVHSVTIDTLVVTGNTAEFSGTGTNRNPSLPMPVPVTFTVRVVDNGEGKKATGPDTFSITGTGFTGDSGDVRGNIQIH